MTSKSQSFTESVRFLMVHVGIETAACLRDIHSSFLEEYCSISINMALNYRPHVLYGNLASLEARSLVTRLQIQGILKQLSQPLLHVMGHCRA